MGPIFVGRAKRSLRARWHQISGTLQPTWACYIGDMEKRRVIEVTIPEPKSQWEPGDRIECGGPGVDVTRTGTVLSMRGRPKRGQVVLTVELDPVFDPVTGVLHS